MSHAKKFLTKSWPLKFVGSEEPITTLKAKLPCCDEQDQCSGILEKVDVHTVTFLLSFSSTFCLGLFQFHIVSEPFSSLSASSLELLRVFQNIVFSSICS